MGNRLHIVSVDLPNEVDTRARVKQFVAKKGAHFPVAMGSEAIVPAYGIEGTPVNMVLAPNGRVVYVANEFDEAALVKAIHRAGG
jgi:hypothetical protein